MEHDNSYKLLFSHARMVEDLLRGFIQEPWVQEVDFTTLERVSESHVSDDLHDREDDLIWRVRWGADWLYIYLLLEFQSTVDRYMAVRLQVYVGLLYQALIRAQQLPPAGRLPPVVPVVLYNGQRRWTAPLEMGALVAEAPGLEAYRHRFPYALLDVERYAEHELAALPNLAAALFRLENSRAPEDVRRVLGAVIEVLQRPEHDSLRRAFTVWIKRVLLPARLPDVSLPEVQDLVEVQTMLAERVIEWTQQWKAEGLQQGRQEGLQQGRAEERTLLLRLARIRFGEACAEALAPLLEARDDPEELASVGEWLVTAATSEDFLTRIRAQWPPR
jgi:predicted transposase YdaD